MAKPRQWFDKIEKTDAKRAAKDRGLTLFGIYEGRSLLQFYVGAAVPNGLRKTQEARALA